MKDYRDRVARAVGVFCVALILLGMSLWFFIVEHAPWFYLFIFSPGIALGTYLGIKAILEIRNLSTLPRRATAETTGEITLVIPYTGDGDMKYTFLIKYTAGEQTYRTEYYIGEGEKTAERALQRIGTTVYIKYDPNNPRDVIVEVPDY